MLENYLKAKGLNRTNINSIIDCSPPTTRLLLDNPLDLKVSQVVSIAAATENTFKEISGIIVGTHNIEMGSEIKIVENKL
jgi:hypothetical protein|tara:strand:+ start:3648 stop:3887 length:240 start_codon:yes stop_codon:yes gene_type:complete